MVERNTGRNALHTAFDNPVHNTDVLGKTAARGFETGRDSNVLVNVALRVQAAFAIKAIAARDVMECNDTIARSEFCHTRTGAHDNPGSLVTEDARRRQQVVLDLFEVGVADPAGLHAY